MRGARLRRAIVATLVIVTRSIIALRFGQTGVAERALTREAEPRGRLTDPQGLSPDDIPCLRPSMTLNRADIFRAMRSADRTTDRKLARPVASRLRTIAVRMAQFVAQSSVKDDPGVTSGWAARLSLTNLSD
jgi:hypothetical protein